jgi:signal transduction histidine kinase
MGSGHHIVRDAAFSEDERDRLRGLIRFDAVTAATAVAVMLLTYVFVSRTVWLPVLCVLVGGSGAVMALGLRPLDRGDLETAVRWLAIANWSVALAAASIATFCWPLMVMAALLPAVMAPPYVPGPRLRWYLVTSLAVAVGAAAIGLLQDFSGFDDALPSWVPPAVVIFFTPFLGWIVAQTALQNSTRLQTVLEQTLAANEQLRRSEEALAEHAASLQASRARLVEATDRERRRVERDLHDGAQQRLVALGLHLRLAQDQCRNDPEAVADVLAGLRDEVHDIRTELRDLAHGVYPVVLTQHGLGDALSAVADRCPIPVDVRAVGIGRLPPPVEAAVYFCCVEALQNAAKHAGRGARVDLSIERSGRQLTFAVVDDGLGFAATKGVSGDGFDNMRDRLGAAGGTLVVTSAPGQGTTVAGTLPAVGR